MKAPTLGQADGKSLKLDLDRIIESRVLLQANSGGGKSWAIRRLLEQTHGRVQHLVLDVEGEFHTLRERFDYVLASRENGDTVADARTAPLLARRLLELGASAILDLYELPSHERVRFVRLFLEALLNAPRKLWHPALVVIDEAHAFAPEKGSSESSQAVIDLMCRGRKRGFCGVLATQRISKLRKDAAAEANVKLIGRAALDVDMRRAAEELGFTTRDDQAQLRKLKPGEFFAFGPGLADEVTQVKIGDVRTTHPKAGQRAAIIPPAPAKLRAILAKLADLPKEAEAEARTAGELRAKVKSIQLELRRERSGKFDVDPAELSELRNELRDAQRRVAELERSSAQSNRVVTSVIDKLQRIASGPPTPSGNGAATRSPATRQVPTATRRQTVARRADGTDVSGPEQRILDAVAWLEATNAREDQEQTAVAFLAGYTVGGGAFNNPRGKLNTRGLIAYRSGRLALTDDGRALANVPDEALTPVDVQTRVLDRLPGPEQKLLRVLIDVYPEALDNTELARRAGYEPGGGAFNNPRGRLRTLGLVDYPERGMVVARPVLFLDSEP